MSSVTESVDMPTLRDKLLCVATTIAAFYNFINAEEPPVQNRERRYFLRRQRRYRRRYELYLVLPEWTICSIIASLVTSIVMRLTNIIPGTAVASCARF